MGGYGSGRPQQRANLRACLRLDCFKVGLSASSESATARTTGRGISYGIDGTDKLVPDYNEFLGRVFQLSEPADAVATFRAAYEQI